MLQRNGISVSTLMLSNDDMESHDSLTTKLKLAGTTIWSRTGRTAVRVEVEKNEPDIVHFDNTFPLISPAAYSVVRQVGPAVVQTLHNFRLLCPNALFFRDGRACEDCLGKTPPLPGVIHGCYRGSRSQSAVVASMLTFHRVRRTWSRDVDRYIALNPFSQRKFLENGLPEDLVVVKPNFVDGPTTMPAGPRHPGVLNVGRLSVEKGVTTLVQAWDRHADLPPITVIGDGPMMPEARAVAESRDHMHLLGRQSFDTVMEQMAAASALVFPSVCYENFPVAIAEAFSNGLPVIASRLGAMAEVVEEGVTGLLFTAGDPEDLATKVRWATAHPDEMRRMGVNARREYEAKYTPERNYHMLMDIYEQAIAHRRHSER